MIYLQNLHKQFGSKIILKNANFHLRPGERVGLVGENGTGKTTLFRIIMKTESPDSGKVIFRKGAQAATLEQELNAYNGSVLERVISGNISLRTIRQEMDKLEQKMGSEPTSETTTSNYGKLQYQFEQLNGYELEPRACAILSGLGFSDKKIKKPLNEFSGGWRMRVEMARLLLQNPDILLLDEPTNHFDLKSVEWLEGFLKNYDGSLLLISHDRRFLNSLVTRIVELEQGILTTYSGNYNDFERLKKEREAQLISESVNQQKRISEIERFIERFRAKNTKATQVQSRIKMLNKMERIETMTDTKTVGFRFPQPVRTGRISMELEKIDKSYGDNIVYQNFSIKIERGWKVALVGENGAGKSTTLKVITGFLAPTAGNVFVNELNVLDNEHEIQKQMGYLPELNPLYTDMTVYDYLQFIASVRGINGNKFSSAFSRVVEECGLKGIIHKQIGACSKGFKQRVGLAAAMIHDPKILILDEPVSGLDPNQIVEIRGLIKRLGRKKLVVISSHILQEIQATVDRIIIIHKGELVADGTSDELISGAQGNTQMTLELVNAKKDAIQEMKAVVPSIKLGRISEEKKSTIVHLEFPTNSDPRKDIFMYAVSKEWVILEMATAKTNLEDIFRKLTVTEAANA